MQVVLDTAQQNAVAGVAPELNRVCRSAVLEIDASFTRYLANVRAVGTLRRTGVINTECTMRADEKMCT